MVENRIKNKDENLFIEESQESQDSQPISKSRETKIVVDTYSLDKDLPPIQTGRNGNSPGKFLKQIRESKGVSLEVVHEATKVPMDALRAIEEGYSIRTMSAFYYRGFVKMYAKYLGIDPSEVLDQVKSALPNKTEQANKESNEIEIIKIQKLIHFKHILEKYWTRERKLFLGKLVLIFLGFFLLFKGITLFTHTFFSPEARVKRKVVVEKKNDQRATNPKKEVSVKPVPIVEEEVVVEEEPVVEEVAVVEEVVEAAVVATPSQRVEKNVTLSIRAKKDSWLRVKTDDVTVFQSTLKKGQVETWSADDDIEILGKNVSQLEFEVNGKMIGALGKADRGAKSIIITKDGLTVNK